MTTNKSYKKRKEKTPPPRASAYLPDFKFNSSTSHPLFRHTFFELCPDISEYVNSFKTSDIVGSGGFGGGERDWGSYLSAQRKDWNWRKGESGKLKKIS